MSDNEHFRVQRDFAGDESAARRARDARAKALRADGWIVKSKRVDFSDLARDVSYIVSIVGRS